MPRFNVKAELSIPLYCTVDAGSAEQAAIDATKMLRNAVKHDDQSKDYTITVRTVLEESNQGNPHIEPMFDD